ncbi:hypothetical protein QBC45DRAFT_71269 [Copromyces sp. CBS 386.78]|nr:hypothetical protein QBC45DRAFT_71269 [Copromyces sp. CBS 386.78]
MSSHSTPGPAAKRRRVELANATLRKPFRSPMINRTNSGDKSTNPTPTSQRKTTELGVAAGSNGAADVGGEEEEDEEEAEEKEEEQDTSFEASFKTSFSSMPTPAARNFSKSRLHYSGSGASGSSSSTRWNAKPPLLDLSNKQKQEQEKIPRATRSAISRKRSSLGPGSTAVSDTTPMRPPVNQQRHTKGTTVVGAAGDGNDAILAGLQKSHREHKVHLVAMQKQLDLIRQAKRIEMASRKAVEQRQDAAVKKKSGGGNNGQHGDEKLVIDAELKELVQKWKLASRQAAEELFELIKGRVADMGGAKAWRETRRRQMEGFHSAWDDEGQKGKKRKGGDDEREIGDSDYSDDEGFSDGNERLSRGAGNNDGGERSTEDDCEDSGFTMLMMLQSLNIEPDVLGYDPNEDKWLD